MSEDEARGYKSPDEMAEEAREALGDLLLILADNKRLLGIRYADWILGAPALEAGISCSAMAQDEWGHGRILYAMLRDFGRDPERLEHEREPPEYRNVELLDEAAAGWPELLALNLLLDSALSVQFEAMRESRFQPIHYKVSKLLDEERFHFEHGRGWTRRLGRTEEGRNALRAAFDPAWDVCLRWFGPPDDALGLALAEAGVTNASPRELRARWLLRVGPVVEGAGLGLAEKGAEGWESRREPVWEGWRPEARRGSGGSGPDPDTLARVRGDRNRALLMD
ncbi:MAG: Phenylacetic acid catabolic protein [Gemmatimonadota bacterium]